MPCISKMRRLSEFRSTDVLSRGKNPALLSPTNINLNITSVAVSHDFMRFFRLPLQTPTNFLVEIHCSCISWKKWKHRVDSSIRSTEFESLACSGKCENAGFTGYCVYTRVVAMGKSGFSLHFLVRY